MFSSGRITKRRNPNRNFLDFLSKDEGFPRRGGAAVSVDAAVSLDVQHPSSRRERRGPSARGVLNHVTLEQRRSHSDGPQSPPEDPDAPPHTQQK